MESGLEGRNNEVRGGYRDQVLPVSMESGLEGRNNSALARFDVMVVSVVSMESGLEGRNNGSPRKAALTRDFTSFCERFAPQTPITTLC